MISIIFASSAAIVLFQIIGCQKIKKGLTMKIKGQVINCSKETKELVGKDGVKRTSVVSHVLMFGKNDDGSTSVFNCRSYDASWELPSIGKEWVTPDIRKYECYDGAVAEVMI